MLFHNTAYKNIYKRFKQFSRRRTEHYECGFYPKSRRLPTIPLNSFVLFSFALFYDVSGVFLFLFLSCFFIFGAAEAIAVFMYICFLFISIFLVVSDGAAL